MLRKAVPFFGVAAVLNSSVYAATRAAAKESNLLVDAVLGFLPILLFIGILFFVFKKLIPIKGVWSQQAAHFERHAQHMERVEAALDRIAKALENRGNERP